MFDDFAWPGRFFPIRSDRASVVARWIFLVVLTILSTLGLGDVAAQEAPTSDLLSPGQWREVLQSHANDFARARMHFQRAREHVSRGDLEDARRELERAASLDPRFAEPRFLRARLDLRERRWSGIPALLEGMSATLSGYRNQTRLAASLVLGLNVVLGVALLWILIFSALRYLPFAVHQLSARVDPQYHLESGSRLLWVAVLAPLLLAWGIVPFLALVVPLVWAYAHRRLKVVLALLLVWFLAQGIGAGPFGAVLVGIDPTSRPALAERAAVEPPTWALLSAIDAALEEHPRDPDLLVAKGLAHGRAGNFETSSASLLAALEQRPNDPIANNDLAVNHYFLGDMDRAVAGFQRSASINPALPVSWYNLSQAYINKLYMREGGDALQKALRLGYDVQRPGESYPEGMVHYQRPPSGHYWDMAWDDRARVLPIHLMGGQARWIGVPPEHVVIWLGAILSLCLLLGTILPRARLVYECVNCGALACSRCRGDHEGAVLCAGCGRTARRARSDMVLQTLLRNRRRDSELVYHRRLRSLDVFGLGASRIYNGLQARGVLLAALLGVCVAGIVFGGLPLSDPWSFGIEPRWGFVRLAGIVGLLLLWFVTFWLRGTARRRHIHPHPASVVSLVGLIEGRPQSRLKAEVSPWRT